jgi:nitrite reductase/ring-hydroxylating ferredoxin subunit
MAAAWHELPNAPAAGQALGRRDDIADGGALMLSLPASADAGTEPFRLLLLRSGQQVLAYVNQCTHFGVPLAQRQEQLIYTPNAHLTCNVHYARYRWVDGACEAGECAGQALMAVPITVAADGGICIAHNGGHD